jgi:hypothetical protein
MAALALASVSAGASHASAQAAPVNCVDLPNRVLGTGGSAATQLIKKIATRLASAQPTPITLVYADPGACQAMSALVPDQATGKVAPLSGSAKYWGADGKENTCVFPSGSTVEAEWGAMAQEATTCSGITALPPSVGDYLGPISGFSLIVPNASEQRAISAEALFFIYGQGAGTGNDVAPWTVPGAIGSRTTTSAAGLLLAKAVGIPTSRRLAYLPDNDVKTNQGAVDFITKVSEAAKANPNAALAFASTETADLNRATVRTLAFKAQGQDCAYYPDSEQTSTDKKNLREGRYYLWNPHHVFAKIDPVTKKIVNPNLEKFVNIFTSKEELPASSLGTTQSYLDLQIENGNVPACAMRVSRTGDMGPLSSFQPEKPCGCYFDKKTTNVTSCQTCTQDSDCPASASLCNVGYCEVK